MAGKKRSDFKPDPQGAGFLSRLYVTRSQRLKVLKWALFSLVGLLLLVLQDVIFSRIHILDATTDLVPGVLLLVCVLRGPESGGMFTLAGALVYYLSGSSPGAGVILVLTLLGMAAAAFRESFLRKGFSSALLCAGVALLLYEMIIFIMGLFLGLTIAPRVGVFALTGVLTVAATAALYPLLLAIDKIGGETWKE